MSIFLSWDRSVQVRAKALVRRRPRQGSNLRPAA